MLESQIGFNTMTKMSEMIKDVSNTEKALEQFNNLWTKTEDLEMARVGVIPHPDNALLGSMAVNLNDTHIGLPKAVFVNRSKAVRDTITNLNRTLFWASERNVIPHLDSGYFHLKTEKERGITVTSNEGDVHDAWCEAFSNCILFSKKHPPVEIGKRQLTLNAYTDASLDVYFTLRAMTSLGGDDKVKSQLKEIEDWLYFVVLRTDYDRCDLDDYFIVGNSKVSKSAIYCYFSIT